jgi:hypothetical protein
MPCVAFDHYFDWGSKLRGEINALLQVGAACSDCYKSMAVGQHPTLQLAAECGRIGSYMSPSELFRGCTYDDLVATANHLARMCLGYGNDIRAGSRQCPTPLLY